MKYERIKGIKEKEFRRLTGIKRKTFEKILEILKKADKAKRIKGGRKSKLSMEDIIYCDKIAREITNKFI